MFYVSRQGIECSHAGILKWTHPFQHLGQIFLRTTNFIADVVGPNQTAPFAGSRVRHLVAGRKLIIGILM